MVLEEISFKVAEAAVRKVVSTHTFFPVPAEIFQAAMGFRLDKPPSAEAAWAEVRKVITSGHLAIQYHYNGEAPQWSHSLEESLNKQILRLAGIDQLMLTESGEQYGIGEEKC
jgi:hypothetical protein